MELLIGFNENKYRQTKEMIEGFIPAIQECVNQFNAMGFKPIEKNELGMLFTDTESLVYDKMMDGKNLSIGDFEVNKHKAMEILHKPTGYESLLQNINQVAEELKETEPRRGFPTISANQIAIYYEFNEENQVIFKLEQDEKIKRQNQKYATTEKTKKLYQLATTVIEKCKELDLGDFIRTNPNGIGSTLKTLLVNDFGHDNLRVNVDEIVRLNINNP